MRPLLYFAILPALCAQVDVLTANYDNNRTNDNLGEFVLNKSNVNPSQFGKLFSLAVDGQVQAQTLYAPRVHPALRGSLHLHKHRKRERIRLLSARARSRDGS